MHIECYDCSTWIQTEDKLYICCVLLLTNWKEQIVNSEVYFTNLDFGDHEYLLWRHMHAIKKTMTHWQHYHFGSQISAHCHIVTVQSMHVWWIANEMEKWFCCKIVITNGWLHLVIFTITTVYILQHKNDNCWESTASCTYLIILTSNYNKPVADNLKFMLLCYSVPQIKFVSLLKIND